MFIARIACGVFAGSLALGAATLAGSVAAPKASDPTNTPQAILAMNMRTRHLRQSQQYRKLTRERTEDAENASVPQRRRLRRQLALYRSPRLRQPGGRGELEAALQHQFGGLERALDPSLRVGIRLAADEQRQVRDRLDDRVDDARALGVDLPQVVAAAERVDTPVVKRGGIRLRNLLQRQPVYFGDQALHLVDHRCGRLIALPLFLAGIARRGRVARRSLHLAQETDPVPNVAAVVVRRHQQRVRVARVAAGLLTLGSEVVRLPNRDVGRRLTLLQPERLFAPPRCAIAGEELEERLRRDGLDQRSHPRHLVAQSGFQIDELE